jgi:hypothetical protein
MFLQLSCFILLHNGIHKKVGEKWTEGNVNVFSCRISVHELKSPSQPLRKTLGRVDREIARPEDSVTYLKEAG